MKPGETLLFLDMLGVRSAWRLGRDEVLARINAFESLIVDAASLRGMAPSWGALETDAAVLTFSTSRSCLAFAEHVYRKAFQVAPTSRDRRVWLRGVITRVEQEGPARIEQELIRRRISRFRYSDTVFDAINAEKAGFKGMRLLVATTLGVHLSYIRVGSKRMSKTVRLKYSGYPSALPFECADFLWCLSGNAHEEAALNNLMQRRLRWSAPDPEEFQQAAATQVLFHETYAQLHSARVKAGIAPPATPYYKPA